MVIARYPLFLLLILSTLLLAACGNAVVQGQSPSSADSQNHTKPPDNHPAISTVIDLRHVEDVGSLNPILAKKRVVYVGESHDNYSHHQAQLAIIKTLQKSGVDLAVGMEMFQRPYQKYLDEYIAGSLSEADMLRKTEWYDRWVFDYRYYRPILHFAKKHHIPIVALNLSREITGQVSRGGISSLSEQQRRQIPADIDYSDQEYTRRLKTIFGQHRNAGKTSFKHFLQVQLLWDEGMAQRAADYLAAHPKKHLVVLAGSGHLMYKSGIPNRVQRRQPVSSAVVIPGENLPIAPGLADFVIFPKPATLPTVPLIGVYMTKVENGGVLVSQVAKGGAAERAGIEREDIIRSIDGKRITSPADLRIALLDKRPGDALHVTVLRRRLLFGDQQIDINLTLGP